ncbi:MAG: efflux RND transporter periplasmic adaptor subunit, partial [Thermodesulfobacteriota bacterium]|nr:efflux RND transporter periplasmic adaptor subunit [Thermodesulfobacteriota bacterium]
MKRIFIYIFIAAVVLCALFFIFRAMDKDKSRDHMKVGQASVSVDAVPAVFHEFEDRIDAVGTLRARETNLLSPKVAGSVDAVLVDIGDWVEAGQVVVLLDRTLFELGVGQSKAAYQAANA